MATNNAPKHDFAPAWLKIPSQDSSKPSGSKQGKRFPPGQSGKFRHHSVDDDYYAYYNNPYNYYNGYAYPEKFGMHYGSQPSLLRSAGQRDSKYQHPHARYSGGQQVNVGYSPYYEFLPSYEYYGNDSYYGNYPQGSRNGGSKRSYYEKEGRSNSKEGKDKEDKKEKENEKDKPFSDDFPSLNGDIEKQTSKGSKQVNGTGTGVWDNPPIGKGSINKGEENSDTSQAKVLRDSKIFKNLVPNKSSVTRHMTRMNGSYPRDQVPFTSIKPHTPTSAHSPGHSKESSGLSPTPPMDILNTPFITQPKTLSDKKRSFLKTLRQEDNDKHHHDKRHVRKSHEGELVNGIDRLGVEEGGHLLSSSLEAEQRLLREMGWNEADQEEYEITEDEKKEFQNLSKQMQQQRNGIVRSIPKTWSPKHIPIYQPPAQELNETLSSSDSDSDDAEF